MKPQLTLDTEIYRDYFLAKFRNKATGNMRSFEMYPGSSGTPGLFTIPGKQFDAETVTKILRSSTIITFNGESFDMPILSLALAGADNAKLKRAVNAVIENNLRSWQLEKKFNFKTIKGVDHVDLINIAPGVASLKIYGGRLHCPKMQDLPIEPSASISPAERVGLDLYCGNDLVVTQMLADYLEPQIALRVAMGQQYGLELRSKSDAQIAEAVIKSEVEKILGEPVERPIIETGAEFLYKAPSYITFSGRQLVDVAARLVDAPFVIADSGKLLMPEWLKDTTIKIGAGAYKMGVGGLHSTESSVAYQSSDSHVLKAPDVASYYPNIILSLGLAPAHMGKAFTKVYKGIVERRLAAKASGDKVTNEVLKIVINGSFGKFGSKWSILYSPDLLLQTTITGQLALLMLIEWMEDAGIAIVSANTDGIVANCPRELVDLYDMILADWEATTGFTTDGEDYLATYSRDVNSYFALKANGKIKTKGVYAPGGLAKTPSSNICVDAVTSYLQHGIPVAETIHASWDISKFITVRSVKGGALDQHGNYLGKAVRFYYATGVTGPLTYKVNSYSVPRTEGARALMDMDGTMPPDLDFAWYVTEAESILKDIGATTC